MELGISTASYFPRIFTEDCFGQIKSCGAEVCEVFLASFCEYGEDFRKVLQSKQTVGVHSVHALTNQFEPEVVSRNTRAHGDCLRWFEEVCKTGEAMGAECYTFHGPTLLKKIKYVFDYPFLTQRIAEICAIALKHGITLTYENVHWAFGAFPEYIKTMLQSVEGLGACLDIKQAMQAQTDYREFAAAMGDKIKTVHLCDYDCEGKLLMPGRGIFDFTEMFGIIAEKNPDCTCLMEVYSSCYEDFSEIKEGFEYLKDCAARAGIKL